MACSAILLAATAAQAVPITVNPGAYQGRWSAIDGAHYNAAMVDLPVGVNWIAISGFGSFLVDVAADGSVTVQNGVSAVGGAGTLTFNTTTLAVDPAAYTGRWQLSGVSSSARYGPATETVVPGIRYGVFVSGFGSFLVDVAADGSVTVQNGVSAVGGAGTLTFNTTTLAVDPAAYTGRWQLSGVSSSARYGPATETVVPGIRYAIFVGGFGHFLADVAAGGNVTVQNGVSAVGGAGTLTFNNVWVTFDPNLYTSNWYISGMSDLGVSGINTFALVPAVNSRLVLAGATAIFEPLQTCSLTPPDLHVSTDVFTLACSSTAPNSPPVADAGVGQNIYLGQTALLDGSASSDPDGDPIVSYTWTFDSAPTGSAFAAPGTTLTGVSPSFTPDLIGDYMLSLVVNDGVLNSAAATVLVTVSQNLPPVATATSDVATGDIPLTVNFDASASYDPEGGLVTYSWNFADPTTGVNNISNLPNPIHTFNNAGTYTVLVDVIDNFGNVTQASVNIIATDPVVVTPLPGGDTGTGSNELELIVHEAKVDYGKEGKVKGKVSVKAGFINIGTPAADDRVAVSLDGVVLLDVPFSEFKAEDKPGEFEYKGKHLKAEINFTRSTIKVKRHKMVLFGIDNSDGVDVEVSIGSLSGFESIEMKAKHDDHEGKRKLSYKNKLYDD